MAQDISINELSALLDSAIGRTLPYSTASAFQVMEQWLAVAGLPNVLNAELRALVEGASENRDWLQSEWEIANGESWRLVVLRVGERQQYLRALAHNAIFVPLSGAVRFSRYRLPDDFGASYFRPDVCLTLVGTEAVQRSALVVCDSTRDVLDCAGPAVMLKLQTKDFRPLEWLFDRNSLNAFKVTDANLRLTQLRIAAYACSQIAHESSLPVLRELTTHPHHAVRWHAIQALGRLSGSHAVECLRKAIGDPHPHIRDAARAALIGLSLEP